VRFSRIPRHLPAAVGGLFCVLIFLCTGYVFVRQAGVQEDEALFASPIFAPKEAEYSIHIGDKQAPVMLTPYIGALKTWLYKAVFRVRPADVRSLRVPALLAGALAIALFFVALWTTIGAGRALMAALLLSADPVFVLTTVYDWGPVVIQHLITASALLLFVLFHRFEWYRCLALASFLCGLAVWDKLTFLWVLIALAAGAAAALRSALRKHADVRLAAFVLVWFLLGAAPSLYYNIKTSGGGWKGAGGVGAAAPGRLGILHTTLNGSALFDWLVSAPVAGTAREPETGVERLGAAISEAAGGPESHALLAVCLAGVPLLPFVWRSSGKPIIVFCLAGMLAGWAAMLPFSLGGGGAHHLVLLWPLPQVLAAAALWEAAHMLPRYRRLAATALAGVLALNVALVTNEYYARIVRWGAADNWSDAVHPMRALLSETPSNGILPLDWGILGPLRLLGRGQLPLRFPGDWFDSAQPTGRQRAEIGAVLEAGHFLFVHYADRTGRNGAAIERLRLIAGGAGYREQTVAEVSNRNGRKVYRIFRFVPAVSPAK
jgi:hypothetical protein